MSAACLRASYGTHHLARLLGVSTRTARRRLRAWGVKVHGGGRGKPLYVLLTDLRKAPEWRAVELAMRLRREFGDGPEKDLAEPLSAARRYRASRAERKR